MRRLFLGSWIFFACMAANAQQTISGDTLLYVHIIGDKICLDKKGSLNFTYYFENKAPETLIVLDYYEPCAWENQDWLHTNDSLKTIGLVAVIKDDSGNVVLPVRREWSLDSNFNEEKHKEDSLLFYETYEQEKIKEFDFHTRAVKHNHKLMNFYSSRLNKRKCFDPGTFVFDPKRKYTVTLHYISHPDALHLLNHGRISKTDVLFVGTSVSNEVNLCFESK